MRVICDAPGQTCNRLWTYVASLSECIVKKKKMVILFFDYTITDFPNLLHSKYIWFPFYQPWYLNRGNGWNNFKGGTWKLTHSKRWDKIFKTLGFVKGWHTRRDTEYIAAAKEELKHIFTPRKEIVEKAEALINGLREQSDLVIGIHIRRGDYKDWNDGRFFYEVSQYREVMLRLQSLYSDKKVSFFISSNEKMDKSQFEGCHCEFHQGGNPILDLHTLSLCDKLVGPYSTFSRWASFIGEKPIYFIEDINKEITEDSFSKMISYFEMENGNVLLDW